VVMLLRDSEPNGIIFMSIMFTALDILVILDKQFAGFTEPN
jgi:hypothetical protein